MRTWLIALFIAPALIVGAAPANAGNSIRTTAEFRDLRAYVQELEAEKDSKATPAQIKKYRATLKKKRAKASKKVREIYQKQMSTARDRRGKRKDKVAKLKAKRTKQTAALKRSLADRIDQIEADRRAAIAKINADYADKSTELKKEQKKLRKKLAKAKTSAKKVNLRAQLETVQRQLDTLVRVRRDDLDIANNKYDDLEEVAKSNFEARIEREKRQATRAIQQQQQLLRELYAEAKASAQARRKQNFAEVRALYERGLGYIKQMENGPKPTPTPTPTPTP